MLRRFAPFTFILIGINLWLAYLTAQYQFDPKILFQWGAMTAKMPQIQSLHDFPPFFEGYLPIPHGIAVWQRGTALVLIRATYASFLHFSWNHVDSNMLTLWILGRMFERTNHFGVLPIVYLTTGIFSMLMALYLTPQALTAGASGAIFGIMGVAITMGIRAHFSTDEHPEMTIAVGRYAFGLGVLNLIYSVLTPHISLVGHVAGLLSGLVLGFIIPRKHF